jgi:hypothetical protein
LSYMTKCNGDCKTYTPSNSTGWFKTSALGLKPGSSEATNWYQADMNNGSPLTVTIPSDLEAGNYLLRHEIIALQNGQTKDRAEFYPNCIQMTISGGSNGTNTTPSPTTTFPGAYKDTDPGILVNVYNPGLNYVMPGPAIANIAQGSSSNPSTNATSTPPTSTPTPTSTDSDASYTVSSPTPTTSTSTSQCMKKRKVKVKRSTTSASGNSMRAQSRVSRAHAKKRMVASTY